MAARDDAGSRGLRRSRFLRQRLADALAEARIAAGLSLRELSRRVGVSADTIIRLEAGDARTMTVDLMARVAPVLGHQLGASLHPDGDPVRDKGQLALLRRLRDRVHRALRWLTEVPIPITGDPRSGDATISGTQWMALIEAETHVADIQLVERRARAKQRDLGADHLILLVADTRHNRDVVRLHPELLERFSVDKRTCLRRLGEGHDPGGDAMVLL